MKKVKVIIVLAFFSCGLAADNQKILFDWVLIARSAYIVEARLGINECHDLSIPRKINIFIENINLLKGGINFGRLNLTKYIRHKQKLIDYCQMNSKRVIAFIYKGDDDKYSVFLDFDNTLILYSKYHSYLIKDLIKENNSYRLDAVKYLENFEPNPKITSLIDDLYDCQSQDVVLKELFEQGYEYIDTIIYEIYTNKHQFKCGVMSLQSNGWEKYIHYRPKKMSDVIDIVLRRLANKGFIPLVNGESKENTKITIDGWLAYLGRELGDK